MNLPAEALCATIFKNENGQDQRCHRKARPGYRFCGTCVGMIKRNEYAKGAIAREKALRVESRNALHALMQKNGVEIELPESTDDFNPFEALLDVAQEQLAFKEVCKAKLIKLREDEWRWDSDRTGEQLRSEVALYERAIQRCTDTLIRISRLNLEERLLRIAERQAAIIEMAIIRTLQDLELPIELQAKARAQIVMHLAHAGRERQQ